MPHSMLTLLLNRPFAARVHGAASRGHFTRCLALGAPGAGITYGTLLIVQMLLSAAAIAQVSVVPSTGIAPRFPQADTELARQSKPPSRRWLRDANDDSERFRRIELWAGAGDLEMQDIAHRLEELQAAIRQRNWDMGIYQWEKIRNRMTVAAIKRPTRTQNLEAIFFESGVYQALHDALSAHNGEQAQAGLLAAREACMACHIAERVGFINRSAVFGRIGRAAEPSN